MEGIQNGDGLGQFVPDSVRVTAERVQRCGLDPGGELLATGFEPVGVGLPGTSRDEVQQPGMDDPVEHPGSRRPGVGPDMFVNAEGVHALQPASPSEPPRALSPDSIPDGVPGNPELVGEGRDGSV